MITWYAIIARSKMSLTVLDRRSGATSYITPPKQRPQRRLYSKKNCEQHHLRLLQGCPSHGNRPQGFLLQTPLPPGDREYMRIHKEIF